MLRNVIPVGVLVVALLPVVPIADDLTKIIQKDLKALGHDPGNIQAKKGHGRYR